MLPQLELLQYSGRIRIWISGSKSWAHSMTLCKYKPPKLPFPKQTKTKIKRTDSFILSRFHPWFEKLRQKTINLRMTYFREKAQRGNSCVFVTAQMWEKTKTEWRSIFKVGKSNTLVYFLFCFISVWCSFIKKFQEVVIYLAG